MSKPKTKKPIIAEIKTERIYQLLNDLSENVESGTVMEWRAAVLHFKDRSDRLWRTLREIKSIANIAFIESEFETSPTEG